MRKFNVTRINSKGFNTWKDEALVLRKRGSNIKGYIYLFIKEKR